jgi:hypothetical protein
MTWLTVSIKFQHTAYRKCWERKVCKLSIYVLWMLIMDGDYLMNHVEAISGEREVFPVNGKNILIGLKW